ncbi:MAG: response regulator transcription factor [Agathobacter sp.]|nr:response regulator transcription factor [Agathobacter sp.]
MKVAIVDDRAEETLRLIKIIETTLPQAEIHTFSSGESFLETWKSGEYALILLDIFMEGILGTEAARQIRKNDPDVRLVFCSTSNEFACESYEVGANYYLHKPISIDSFRRMLDMIKLNQYEMNRFIHLPDGQKIVLRNIIYSEYHNHLITIVQRHGESIQTRMSQTDWEALLSDFSYFYSCSKGILVNFYEITKQEDSMFLMSDGSYQPISRRKAKEALEKFTQFRFDEMRKGGI